MPSRGGLALHLPYYLQKHIAFHLTYPTCKDMHMNLFLDTQHVHSCMMASSFSPLKQALKNCRSVDTSNQMPRQVTACFLGELEHMYMNRAHVIALMTRAMY